MDVVRQPLRRRAFLLGLVGALAPALVLRKLGLAALPAACLPKTLRVPAKHMKARADIVRTDFVSTHLEGSSPKPYPFAKAFHTSSMLPNNTAVAERLLRKGDGFLRLQGDLLVNGKQGDPAIDAQFNAELCGKIFRMTITFPGFIQVRPRYNADSLAFEFVGAKPLISLNDNLPNCGTAISIGLKQTLDKVTVSTTELRIETSDYNPKKVKARDDKETECRHTLILDFTTDAKDLIAAAWSAVKAPFLLGLKVMIVSTVLLLQLGSACCGPNCPPPKGNQNNQNLTCQEVRRSDCCGKQFDIVNWPYVNMGNNAYSTTCQQGPYNNTCSYVKVAGSGVTIDKGCKLDPCAGQTVPTGWKKIGVKTELSRCSGDIYNDNVMIIQKQ